MHFRPPIDSGSGIYEVAQNLHCQDTLGGYDAGGTRYIERIILTCALC